MGPLSRFFVALALILAVAVPAAAQDISPEQHQALADRIASFDTAMKESDMQTVMGVVPPRVLEKIAGNSGLSVADLLAAMQGEMDKIMGTVEIVSFGMELEAATFVTLPSGLVYAMIPTETVIDLGANGGKMKATSKTLGLLDGETWYLVRVDDPAQATMLKEIYPAFADVEFPPAVTEPVTE